MSHGLLCCRWTHQCASPVTSVAVSAPPPSENKLEHLTASRPKVARKKRQPVKSKPEFTNLADPNENKAAVTISAPAGKRPPAKRQFVTTTTTSTAAGTASSSSSPAASPAGAVKIPGPSPPTGKPPSPRVPIIASAAAAGSAAGGSPRQHVQTVTAARQQAQASDDDDQELAAAASELAAQNSAREQEANGTVITVDDDPSAAAAHGGSGGAAIGNAGSPGQSQSAVYRVGPGSVVAPMPPLPTEPITAANVRR